MVNDPRSRAGKLTISSTDYPLHLARHREVPYRPQYRKVWPQRQDIPGAEGKVAGDPYVRYVNINKFSAGEGEDLWLGNGTYDKSTNVRPKNTGEGLILGAAQSVTVNDNGTPATFVDGQVFGKAQGKLWAGEDNTIHEWQPATENWEETGWATGASGSDIITMIDQGDGSNILVGLADKTVRQVSSGANAVITYAGGGDLAAFVSIPTLTRFGGTMYALDYDTTNFTDDLYSFTMSVAEGTFTQVSDVPGRSTLFLASNPLRVSKRLSVSDKGPIWYQRLDSGETYLWEYNEADNTTARIGKLPVDFAYPYSIFFGNGFYFIGFRYASDHDVDGDAYVYFQRGSQRGVAGPFRKTVSLASVPVLIGGIIGDDLIIYHDGAVWQYNLSSGGITMLGQSDTTNHSNIRGCTTFGKDVFLSDNDAAEQAERFDTTAYVTSGTWDSGRFDAEYPGIKKALLDVTVVTEPLPASTSVTLKVAADGGSFTSVTGTHEVDNATTYTWTVSSSTATTTGSDFEIQLGLAGTSSATPTIRSVTARVTAATRQRQWLLELDVGTFRGGRDGKAPTGEQTLSDLETIIESANVAQFTNPWSKGEYDAASTYDVTVELAELAAPDDTAAPFVQLLLTETKYV